MPPKPRLEVTPEEAPHRIDTRMLRPRDVEIVTTEYVDGEPEERVYTVRGNLPTDTVIEIFELEQQLKEIDPSDRQAFIAVCDDVNALINELIQERHPGAVVKFSVAEVMGVLAFLAQNKSVEHEVAEAITGSGTRPQNRETRRQRPPRKTAAARRASASS